MGSEAVWMEVSVGDWNDPFDNKTVTIRCNSMYN
jgi:hypothetical protein